MNDKTSVAVLGLGIMGAGMAQQVQAAGFALSVYNRNPDKTAPFAAKGARVAKSAYDAASAADIVIVIVSDDAASRALWLGEDGALAGAKRGAVLIDCSTLMPAWVRELAAKAEAKGCGFLDAPVTGSKVQAESGKLRFLVGGEQAHLAKAMPVFDVMGSEVVALGPAGSGATLKLINNFISGVQAAATAEALVMIERSGLDPVQARGVLENGAPGSPMVKLMLARMSARDYAPNFLMPLMAKDMGYAAEEAKLMGIELASAHAARARFLAGVAAGLDDKDISAVIEPLRNAPR